MLSLSPCLHASELNLDYCVCEKIRYTHGDHIIKKKPLNLQSVKVVCYQEKCWLKDTENSWPDQSIECVCSKLGLT